LLFRRLNPGLTPVLEVPKPGGHSRFQLYVTRLAGADATWLDPSARLGDTIALRGFRLSSWSARAGDTVRLTLFWQATGRPPRNYTVFNHVEDATGRIMGQMDGQPDGGRRPTGGWHTGDIVGDTYDLEIKPDAVPGTYDLFSGMYELATQQRLPVRQAGQPASDRVVLGRFTVLAE
jgi:hypothetical protein